MFTTCPECRGACGDWKSCNSCRGSGEGGHDGSRCSTCKGRGVEWVECETCEGMGEVEE